MYDDAIGNYKQALFITPSLSDALKSMMVCYEALQQRDKMFAYLDEFMLKNPENSYRMMLKFQLYSYNRPGIRH